MSHDDARICDVLTSVRDAMVSQLVAADLGEIDTAAMWARRAADTMRAWLTGDDLARAVRLLLSEEAHQIATRIGTGVALVTPQTGTAEVALRAAVNGRAGAPGRAPVRAQRNHPGPAVAGPGPCPNNQEEEQR